MKKLAHNITKTIKGGWGNNYQYTSCLTGCDEQYNQCVQNGGDECAYYSTFCHQQCLCNSFPGAPCP